MPATGRFKYFLAFFVGLAAAIFYIVASLKLSVKVEGAGAALLFSAAAGVIICLLLAYDITCHKKVDNGKLHEERFSLILALMFPTFFGVQSVIDAFATLERRSEHEAIEWIAHTWGELGDCELSTFTVRLGQKERQLIFETDGKTFNRMILGTPTENFIRTDHGIYRFNNGIMTTTEEGFETKKFESCD
jgi:hypothetical protein